MLALVTGGLHRMGAAIATRLAEQGYDLALHAHEGGAPDEGLAAAIERHGVRHAVFSADLADANAVTALVERVADHFGTAPDALVNNASIISEGDWSALDHAQLLRHFEVNLFAPLLLIRSFAAKAPAVAVVNLLDQRVLNPPIDQAAYTASKLALASVTRVLARAFAPAVRVNAVAPGNTIPAPGYGAEQWRKLAAAMPLERSSSSQDIADAVVFLLRSPAVTGQVLFVDGGAHLESYERDFIHMMRE
jgi:pteridine reductase